MAQGPVGRSLARASRAVYDHLGAERPTLKTALLLCAAALLVRVLFVTGVVLVFAPDFDGSELGMVAINLHEGRGLSSPLIEGDTPTAFFCPLVPMLWAWLMEFTDGPNAKLAASIMLLQTVPSAFTVSCYWLVAHRMFRRMPSMPRLMPVAVAVAFVIWPEALLRVTDTWYYVWQQAGIAALVLGGAILYDRPTIRLGLLLGVVAGVTALVNPVPMPVYAVTLLAALLRRRNRRGRVLVAVLLSGLTAVAITTPWMMRNHRAFGEFVPFRSNFGIELRQGNNPQGSIRQCSTSRNPAVNHDEYLRFESMGEIAYAEWAMGEATAYMRQHPGETAGRIAKRVYVTWFTDLLDSWSWFPERNWWEDDSLRFKATRVVTTVTCLATLVICLVGLLTGRLRRIPYVWLFASVCAFLPLPYYFTSAGDVYSEMVRPWLAILAIIVLLRWRRGRAQADQLPEG